MFTYFLFVSRRLLLQSKVVYHFLAIYQNEVFSALDVVVFLLPDDIIEALSILRLRGTQQTIAETVVRVLVNLALNNIISISRDERVAALQRERLVSSFKAQCGTTKGRKRIELGNWSTNCC